MHRWNAHLILLSEVWESAFHQRLISGSKRLVLCAEESLGLRSGLLAGE
jgi:hypothetical protein